MSKEKLIDLEHEQLGLVKVIIRRHIPGKTVWAYGSRVTWKASDISDLDLAVFGCSSAEVGDLKEAFEESSLLVSVGVMDWESNPEKFAESVGQRYVVVQRGLERWREVRLEDVAEKIAMGPFGSNIKVETFKTKGIPIISGQHLHETRLRDNKFNFISEEHADKLRNSNVFRGDVIFTHRGNIGQVSFIPENSQFKRYVSSQSQFYLRCRKDKINYEFITYYFKSPYGQHQILANSSQTGVPSLAQPATFLKNLKITLPPLPEQKAIAEVLSSLDDKIDLLHRQNKTLEDMAQALFRKWFVEEADEGWEEKPLDKIANYLNGLACQKYPPHNETDRLPVLKIKDLRNGIDGNSDWVVSEVKDEYIVERGDIIFSWSGSLMIKLWDGVKCVLNQHLFKVSSTGYPKWYIYLWTKHHIDKFVQIAESKATTMGHIKRGDISNSMVLVPTSEELSEMDSIVSPLLEGMILNFKQLHTLKNLRDTLLPKLMSGDERIEY